MKPPNYFVQPHRVRMIIMLLRHRLYVLYFAFIFVDKGGCSVHYFCIHNSGTAPSQEHWSRIKYHATKLRGGGETLAGAEKTLTALPSAPPGQSINQRIRAFDRSVGNSTTERGHQIPLRGNGVTDSVTIAVYGLMEPTEQSMKTAICSAQAINGWLVCNTDFAVLEANKIFIRKCYEEIADDIIQRTSFTKRTYLTVSGTLGVGKSVFSNYLLWKMIREDKRVLFMSQYPHVYYDGKGGVFDVLVLPAGRSKLWGPDLWVLVDSQDPTSLRNFPYQRCSIVLFTTASADITSQFLNLKPVPIKLWIPVWTKDETKAVAEGLYIQNVDDWEHRFDVLGGIPRHIFECSESPIAILRNACTECDFKTCTTVITLKSPYTLKSEVCQILIHLNCTSPYRSCEVVYASKTAVTMIAQKYSDILRIRMESLLGSCAGNRLTATLCGYIFEPYSWKQLVRGGYFRCRQLVDGQSKDKPKPFDIFVPTSPQSIPVEAHKVDQEQIQNQLYVHTTTNHATIDAWIPGFGGLQMAVGKKHDINVGAVGDLQKLGANGNKLFFIVPPLYFHSYTKKSPQTIDQYVLQIGYPPVLRKRGKCIPVGGDGDF